MAVYIHINNYANAAQTALS